MIKSNPIIAGWATHKLENHYTTEVLPLEWRLWATCQASQPGGSATGGGIPREPDFEGQQDVIAGLPQDWGKQETPLLEGTHKVLCAPGPRGKEQWPHRRLNQTYLLVLEGLLQSWGWLWLTMGTRTLAAPLLVSTHWCEPSRRPPLAPPNSLQAPVQGRLRPNTNMEGTQPSHQQTSGLKFYWACPAYPPPVPLIRKLARAS